MTARADLHVHSRHSNRPTEWALRQLGAPESFTAPSEIYRLCRQRGMDFVTVSDHDSVAGGLEIAHLPGTFLSSEVTVSFPEDGCQFHCLVTGVTAAQHAEIQRLRGNVYELRDYLAREDVLCSVAHPLVRVDSRLTLAHLEKLLVLFDRFEGLNGIHDRRANEVARLLLGRLTREVVADLADRHRLTPWGATPWIKRLTGGSDDHGGFYIATTWTATPPAATVAEYLAHLKAGRHEPGGATGSTLRLTQSLYAIAYEYYRRRFRPFLADRRDPFARLLQSLAEGPSAEPPRRRFGFLPSRRRPAAGSDPAPDATTFGFASAASRDALRSLLVELVGRARRGRLAESLGAVSNLAPLALTLAPYLVATHAQHRDRDLVDGAAERFLGARTACTPGEATAWFTDNLSAASSGAVFGALRGAGPLTAITCGLGPPAAAGGRDGLNGLRVRAFRPLAEIPIPGERRLTLALPPLLEILEHCERERYTAVLVSTPGPLGLLGLAVGRLLGLEVWGICDPAFPARVRQLTASDSLAASTWEYLRWLFGRMDGVLVGSRADRELLLARGFEPAKVAFAPALAAGLLEEMPLESVA